MSGSQCLVGSVQLKEHLFKGHGGDRAEELGSRRGVLLGWSGPGPALVELGEEVRVLEGPPEDDGLQQVDEGHHHEADEEEGDEGPEVVPGHRGPVAEAAEPALPVGVGGVAGGIRGRRPIGGLVGGD